MWRYLKGYALGYPFRRQHIIGNFIAAAVMALAAAYIGLKYRTLVNVVKQLCIYIDKLTVK